MEAVSQLLKVQCHLLSRTALLGRGHVFQASFKQGEQLGGCLAYVNLFVLQKSAKFILVLGGLIQKLVNEGLFGMGFITLS